MGKGRKRILVVEDDPQVRSLLKVMLTEAGFDVVTANDGTGGFRELRRRRGNVGLVVTDIDMGRMNGKELAESVRSEFPAVPILFVSGIPVPASELQEVAPGTLLVTKPFDNATLVQAVQKLVAGH